jgi:hypothetical protein
MIITIKKVVYRYTLCFEKYNLFHNIVCLNINDILKQQSCRMIWVKFRIKCSILEYTDLISLLQVLKQIHDT